MTSTVYITAVSKQGDWSSCGPQHCSRHAGTWRWQLVMLVTCVPYNMTHATDLSRGGGRDQNDRSKLIKDGPTGLENEGPKLEARNTEPISIVQENMGQAGVENAGPENGGPNSLS